ncbi:hypothetical protein T11_6508 [Trichinella zimbabwensis]|uniref:Uncharacterized protein n=1 Tax=Trichinella zimbabwensis TaxID=268475 RepID=A0A0V1IA77_9BILA|nr:hypothetical protein T11_6508 [Trichinella zimbabwensis]
MQIISTKELLAGTPLEIYLTSSRPLFLLWLNLNFMNFEHFKCLIDNYTGCTSLQIEFSNCESIWEVAKLLV